MPRKKAAAKVGTTVATRKTMSMATIQQEIQAQLGEISDSIAPGGSPFIKVDQDSGSFFEVPNIGEVPAPADFVVIDFLSSFAFWTKAYNKRSAGPPDCYAIGRKLNKMAPGSNAPDPQAESCSVCPMNEFGSAGDGKACNNNRLLAVLNPTDPDGDIMLIRVTKTGLKSWDTYVKGLTTTFKTLPCTVVTTFNVEPTGPDTQGYKLSFNLREAKPLEDSIVPLFYRRREEAGTLLLQEPTYSTENGDSEAEAPTRRASTRKKTAKKRAARR